MREFEYLETNKEVQGLGALIKIITCQNFKNRKIDIY